ncbi:Gfo/Idh/MocA family protein [Alicyclobacillus sp. SO9]|uniref:Gfo/Idh/MocA family protein n=1 Tax=Alicyclobacillus sp. SO9 TaxID=2665646 RepID=UPI0018E8FEFA|nr:Gfo/Idh/MocA family oxidoreductase [Alicyclobacillus sp. SO9]QQE77969.1 Gfo/Idh/MocA family oxidoreductase [Alicyclobacillus sp. SO9]
MKKIGVVGAGYWSQTHLRAWSQVEGATVQCLCDTDEAVLKERGAQFQIDHQHLYTELEELLQYEDIDAVDIVTKPDTHREIVEIVAKTGRDILCQKPFAQTVQEAQDILKTVERHRVRLMVTENWRWLEPFRQVKLHIQSQIIGNIQQIRFLDCKYATPTFAPDRAIPQPYFRTMPNLLFFEMGIHWLDVWRYLFGEPVSLYAAATRISPYVQGEDTGVVTLKHEGFFGHMDVSWASRRSMANQRDECPIEQMIVEGDRATLILYQDNRLVLRQTDGTERVLSNGYKFNMEESFSRLQRHFLSCLQDGTEFQTSGADNLKTLSLVFAVYESLRTNQVVDLN